MVGGRGVMRAVRGAGATPAVRHGPRARGVILAAASVIAAAVFWLVLLLVEHRWAPLLRLDAAARDALNGYGIEHIGFVRLMQAMSWLGSTRVWFVVFGVIGLLLARCHRGRLAVFVVVTVLGSSLLNSMVKAAVGRVRPTVPDPVAQASGWSFPSGHAQAALVGYAVLLFLVLPRLAGPWRWLAVAVAVVMVSAIGFSRVALGVHYVSDVMAGYVLAAAWVLAVGAVLEPWRGARISF